MARDEGTLVANGSTTVFEGFFVFFVLRVCLSNGDFWEKLTNWIVFPEEGGLWG